MTNRTSIVIAILLVVSSDGLAESRPTSWSGGEFPESGKFECRAAYSRKPPPSEVPPTLLIEYSKTKQWVKVTFGGKVFEKTDPLLKDGPMTFSGDVERYGWTVNVARSPKLHGWSWFTMGSDRIDWSGFCALSKI